MTTKFDDSAVGWLTLNVHATSGRNKQYNGTKVKMRCDAIAARGRHVLLVSVVGPQSTVKALRGALAGNGGMDLDFEGNRRQLNEEGEWEDQPKNFYSLQRISDGYEYRQHRLDGGLWHLVAIAKTPGLMLNCTEDSLWDELHHSSVTTPMVREWMPWMMERMRKTHDLVYAECYGCTNVALVRLDTDRIDRIVGLGVEEGHLKVGDGRTGKPTEMPASLDDYLLRYGPLLGRQAERSLDPLHVPGRDPLPEMELHRQPYEAQAHVIESVAKAWRRQKSVFLVGEMGTGKTLLAMVSAHRHANGRPYRGLVYCPNQLVEKWGREIEQTIPGAHVTIVRDWRDVLQLDSLGTPERPEWWIIPRDRGKLGSGWRPAFKRRRDGYVGCPSCGCKVLKELKEGGGTPLTPADLKKNKTFCRAVELDEREVHQVHSTGEDGVPKVEWWFRNRRIPVGELKGHYGCGSALWQSEGKPYRYAPAEYIKRRHKKLFRYLVVDETHEEKSPTSAQGLAAGMLMASTQYVALLTGTLTGGQADHLHPLLMRACPQSLLAEGIGWRDGMKFTELYGRIEERVTRSTTVKEDGDGEDNRQSRGSSKTTRVKNVRPGIMPSLYGRHLIDKCVFISLNDVVDMEPPHEQVIPVAMDAEQRAAYKVVEEKLTDRVKEMARKGDKRLLGTMLQTLLRYPDHPYGWDQVGYYEMGTFIPVVRPRNLDQSVRPKEQALIDLCLREKAEGRQVWVYVQFVGEHDVQERVRGLLEQHGLKARSLVSSKVPPEKREAWIAQHGPGADVIISHPRPVSTGLDFFDKEGRHNFPTICFYETGYSLFDLRQASRRSWRIGQRLPCRVYFLAYEDTMQERAIALMGKKMEAAQALEGRFSSEGLVAMCDDGDSMEVALAKSLAERIDLSDMRRNWKKLGTMGEAMKPMESMTSDELHEANLRAQDTNDRDLAKRTWDERVRRMLAAQHPETPSEAGETELPGAELVAWMRRAKVKVAELAAELGLPQRRVTAARKAGVPVRESGPWRKALERLGKTPEPKKKPSRSRAGTSRSRPAAKSNGRTCR